MTHYEHDREHYRIEYRTAARPRFRVLGTVVRLIDRDEALPRSVGMPLGVVLEEQRCIRERHQGSGW
jgi:hypothetical protein